MGRPVDVQGRSFRMIMLMLAFGQLLPGSSDMEIPVVGLVTKMVEDDGSVCKDFW